MQILTAGSLWAGDYVSEGRDQLQNLGGPVQSENAGLLVQKVFRISVVKA